MRGFGSSFRAVAGVIALLIVVAPSAEAVAQQNQPVKQSPKRPAADNKPALKQLAAENKSHRLVLQVNANDPATMNLALNNATNVAQYYGIETRRWRSKSSHSVRACICCATTHRR